MKLLTLAILGLTLAGLTACKPTNPPDDSLPRQVQNENGTLPSVSIHAPRD